MGKPFEEENSREEREAGGELTKRSNVVTQLLKSSVTHAVCCVVKDIKYRLQDLYDRWTALDYIWLDLPLKVILLVTHFANRI